MSDAVGPFPPRPLLAAAAFLLGVALAVATPFHESRAQTPGSPQQIYQAACASCHGADGRGAPPSTVAFDLELPDFTDCSFATREPDADWWAISHQGGPVRAFDRMMPSFGEALTAAQIDAAMEHVRTFCPERAWPRGELNLPRPLVTEKAYPEDEAVLSTAAAAQGPGAVGGKFVYEKRVWARSQVELVVPFGTQRMEAGNWAGGLGDLALAFKSTVFHSLRSGSIVSLTGEVILPTGDAAAGLSKEVVVFEPFLTYGQILPADGFLQFQGGFELPAKTEALTSEAFWRFALGKSFSQGRFGRTWSPMVELLAARELESGATTQWDAIPQLQVTLSTRQHVMANVGVRFPLTDSAERPTQVLGYLLWDWFDGGFLDGW